MTLGTLITIIAVSVVLFLLNEYVFPRFLGRKSKADWLTVRTLKPITIHTVEGHTIDGLLVAATASGLILRSARFLEGDGEVPLAGESYIPREKISFVQG